MIYKIERFCDGYKCSVADSLWPELVFYAQRRCDVIDMASRFVYHKTYREVRANIEIQEEKSKGYSF